MLSSLHSAEVNVESPEVSPFQCNKAEHMSEATCLTLAFRLSQALKLGCGSVLLVDSSVKI